MKKIYLLASMCFFFSHAFSQITLQSSFPQNLIYHAKYKNCGDKLIYADYLNNVITLYNLDQSVYKTINVPSIPTNTNGYGLEYLSESLFDTDSSTFEYLMIGSEAVNNQYLPHTYIIDEQGNILFVRDTLSPAFVYSGIVSVTGHDLPIFSTDSGTYMRLTSVGSVPNIHHTEFYKLPGKLYEGCCCEDGFQLTGEEDANKPAGNFSVNSFPNPSQSSTKVFYNLPDGITHGALIFYDMHGNQVKRFQVSNLFRYILVSTDNLPSATYVYRIETSQGISEGKQQIVIR